MTVKQKHMVEYLKAHHLKVKSYGNEENYETKKYEVKEDGKWVFVLSEIGSKGDENTMASIFCRDRRHLMIGPNGGIRLLNEKNGHQIEGLFRSFNCIADR